MAAVQPVAGLRSVPKTGQHIFIYNHVRTKQIVYSLTRTLKNNKSIKQLPFLGKNTVPASLRKDFWTPLATVSFPSSYQGLKAFQQLREFKKRHEHEWSQPANMTRLEAARLQMDQKANSIADLAAVLLMQGNVAAEQASDAAAEKQKSENGDRKAQARLQELNKLRQEAAKQGTEEAWARFKPFKAERMRLRRNMQKPVEYRALEGYWDTLNNGAPPAKYGPGRRRGRKGIPPVTLNGVKIEWANPLDAEFAETWPQDVVHDGMSEPTRRTRNLSRTSTEVASAFSQIEARHLEQSGIDAMPRPEDVDEAMNREQSTETGHGPGQPPSRLQRLVDRLRNGREGA